MPKFRFRTTVAPYWNWEIVPAGEGQWLLRGVGPASAGEIERLAFGTPKAAAAALLSGKTGSATWNYLPFDAPPRSETPFELSGWRESED